MTTNYPYNNTMQYNQLSNRNIIVERHIIPADLYQQWYINPNTSNQPINIPSHIHRRAERMNHNLSQSLSDILYGRTNMSTTNSQNSNIATESNVLNTMRFIVRDSNGTRIDYNMPLNEENIGDFSNIINQMLDPNVPLNNVFERRLTDEQIENNTSIRIYSNNDSTGDTCSICREEYVLDNELRKLNNCSHEFHKDCIDEWLNVNVTCPICRRNII
jgi:hypothetical protein